MSASGCNIVTYSASEGERLTRAGSQDLRGQELTSREEYLYLVWDERGHAHQQRGDVFFYAVLLTSSSIAQRSSHRVLRTPVQHHADSVVGDWVHHQRQVDVVLGIGDVYVCPTTSESPYRSGLVPAWGDGDEIMLWCESCVSTVIAVVAPLPLRRRPLCAGFYVLACRELSLAIDMILCRAT